ncbi:MAG TPA: hypothetical protein VMT27_09460 [Actinomycetes bacterium]|nr:hypothetical protein [Actinomycetes bacterium]
MATIVLVTSHALGQQDAKELVAHSSGDSSPSFFVAVPEKPTSASMSAVIDDWQFDVAAGKGSEGATRGDLQQNPASVAEHQAQEILDASLAVLRDAGASAEGEVTPNHPLDSIGDIVAHHKPAEVVVMVRHHRLSEVTSTDLASKIQRKFGVKSLRVKAH